MDKAKYLFFWGQALIMSSLTCTLLHLQVPSSVPCYNPVLPSSRLGDDPYVCRLYSVATVDL